MLQLYGRQGQRWDVTPELPEINWGHPITLGLEVCLLFNVASGSSGNLQGTLFYDLVTGEVCYHSGTTGTNDYVQDHLPGAVYRTHTATGAAGAILRDRPLLTPATSQGSGGLSMVAGAMVASLGVANTIAGKYGASIEYIFGWHSASRLYFWVSDNNNSSSSGRFASSAPSALVWHNVAACWDGATVPKDHISIWSDGKRIDDNDFVSGSFTQVRDTAQDFKVAFNNGGIGGATDISVSYLYLFRRGLLPDEVFELNDNPSCILTIPNKYARHAAGGGGGGRIPPGLWAAGESSMSWLRGQQFWAYYSAWDTVNSVGKTGDKAQHTVKISKDGAAAATATNSGHASNHVELANGEYAILITGTEATCDSLNVFGSSSSTGIMLIPSRTTMLRLPNVDPGASGGLPTTNSSNQVAIQPDAGALHSGTAHAGASGSITLAAGASSTTDLYKGNRVKITSGTGAGQTRTITAYNGTAKVATVDWNWLTTPDNTSVYALMPADGPSVNSSLQVSTTASDPWSTALPGTYTSGQAGYIIGTNLNATVSSRAVPGDQMALQASAGALHSGTAQAGAASTITLAVGASSTTDLYKGNRVKISSGTGAGRTRTITAYNGTTKVATVDWSWLVNPDNTSVYAVMPADGPSVNSSLQVSTTASDPWSTSLPGPYTPGQAGYLLGTNLDDTVSSRAQAGDQMALTNAAADLIRTRQMTEGYAADGVAPTLEEAVFAIMQGLLEFGISGLTLTTRKLDKTTAAMTHTLNDANNPTTRTRAS